MNLKAKLLGLTTIAGLGLSAGMAFAAAESLPGEVTSERVIAAYSATYDRIEVKVSPTQIKVEAFDLETMEKIEVVYDRADGTSPLKVESRTASYVPTGDDATGTEVKSTTGDFVKGRDFDDDEFDDDEFEDDDLDEDEDGDGIEDDEDDHGNGRGRGRGGDDDDDSAESDDGDDHGGHGRGRGRGRGGDHDASDSDDDSDED